jgi:hypothetical protein
MRSVLYLIILIWLIHLSNGEVIRAKSYTRSTWEPMYKIITEKDKVIYVPFTSIIKIMEE